MLAALIAVPLVFAVFTDRVFEPEKAALLRALALVAAAGGLVAWRSARPEPGRIRALLVHPVVLAAAALWIAEALATLGSVAPWTSVMGSPSRGQGLATTSALAVMLLAAIAIALRPGGALRMAAFMGVTVFPAGLYGVIQSYGLDPLPWAGDVVARVVGPAGASVLLGAHLIMALPFAAWLAARAWSRARRDASIGATLHLATWLAALAVGLWALMLSGGRGPILGLGAGAAVAMLAWLAREGRWKAALGVAGMGAVVVVLILGLNIVAQRGVISGSTQPGAATGLLALTELPLLGRLSRALDPENSTTRVRLRLWDGSVEAVAAAGPRLLVGHGPETMDLSYAPFYPPILAYDEPRGWVPDRAHNLALDTMLATGILGLLTALAFYTALVDACLCAFGLLGERRDRRRWLGFWVVGGVAGILAGRALAPLVHPHLVGTALPAWTPAQDWILAGPGLGLGLLGGLALWLLLAAWARRSVGALELPDLDRAVIDETDLGQAEHGETMDAVDSAATRLLPSPVVLPFATAALAAVIAHLAEAQVGFDVTVPRLFLAVIAGGLVGLSGLAQHGLARPLPAEAGDLWPDPPAPRDAAAIFGALVVGATLVFDFARSGAVAGGHATAAVLAALSVLITGLAMAGMDFPVGDPDSEGRHARRRLTVWLAAGLALAIYALVHTALLAAGSAGPADAIRAVAWTLAWYGLALLGAIAAWVRWSAGSWPARREALAGGLAIGLAVLLAALVNGGPILADALHKEGRLGWQAPVSGLLREGESGKAESFLDRAEARYALAARLAPWEPAYRLALARAAVERGDLLDARLSREWAETGQADLGDEYRADLSAPFAALVVERDRAFDAALAEIGIAERLSGPAPGPAITRARALRVWGDRTRAPERRRELLGKARAAYTAAIALAPRWPELLDEAAATAILDGDPRAALDLTGRSIALDGYFVRAWRTAASAHADLGDPPAAAEAYARYFEDYRNSSDLPALRAYLQILVAAGRAAEALPIARDITRLAPGDPHAHADLAVLLDETGDPAAALAAARRAAKLDPGDPAIGQMVRELGGAGE